MNTEESKRLADYILSVICTLKTNSIAVQHIGKYRMDVGYYKTDEDEYYSDLKIFNTENEGLKLVFGDDQKKNILENGVDKDDYFNVSLTKDLLLNYEDISRVLIEFSQIREVCQIVITYYIYKLVIEGKLDGHTTILTE